ncbi:hypothetical protein FRB98_000973 [Tulasnella sp. 332]|nr:hypothetical protein FRB98_000973 [Tulasnella sp. 332]
MTESAKEDARLHREIKGLLSDFKKSIKTCDPWDREIEFQRNNIRRRIVHLLFAHPYSSHAQTIEGPLWLDLTHAIINVYRARMTALEQPSTSNTPKPFVQLRKLQNKFRSFLSAEQSFWSGLALRIVRTFELHEAQAALVVLNITSPDPPNPDGSRDSSSQDELTDTSRNHNRRRDEINPPPGSREKKIFFVYKVLLYLGDLARYREQYNEKDGRPKASHSHTDDYKPKRGRGGKKAAGQGQVSPRERDYARAGAYYHQARLMLPDVGNASNQLAVLAIWSGDSFSSVYYCYRALCVKEPFPTAPDNLAKTLHKAVDQRRKGMGDVIETESDAFKAEVVYLHGLWHLKPGSSSLPKQLGKVATLMQSLIETRSLSSEVIVKTLVMALGALWNLRMYSQPLPGSSAQATQSQASTKVTSSKHSEPFILAHILNLFRILMQVGVSEMQGVELSADTSLAAMGQQQSSSLFLAQRITATFRRTLPALRIASKWLKCHLEYVRRSTPEADIETPPTAFDAFWTTYAAFANALTKTFDDDDGQASCPPLTTQLEEDVDMQGFAPLKRSMFGAGQDVEDGTVEAFLNTVPSNVVNAFPEGAVHPNEEQLMRIGDLLVDAKFISQSPASSIYHRNETFFPGMADDWIPLEAGLLNASVSNSGELDHQAFSDDASHRPAISDDDDDADYVGAMDVQTDADHDLEEGDDVTVSTRTDDDPVNLAMRATLDSERGEDFDDNDDEEEMILYPIQRKASVAPLATTTPAGYPQTPTSSSIRALPAAINLNTNLTPTRGRTGGLQSATTAEDLLAQAMGGGSIDLSASSSRRPSSFITPSSSQIVQPILAHPASTRSASFNESRSHATSAITSTPMLFGASSSVWGPTSKNSSPAPIGSRRSKRGRRVQSSQAYSLSQSQIGLNHQPWGSPHDIFGGGGTGEQQRIALQQQQTPSPPHAPEYYDQTQSTLSSQQTYTGAPHLASMPGAPIAQFNPAVGSPARPGATADQYRQQGRHRPPAPMSSTSLNQYQLDAVGTAFPVDLDPQLIQPQAHPALQQGMYAGNWTPGSATW